MNIVLIGMPGCGKTTISALLSAALGYETADTDKLVEEKYGPIPEIFRRRGEAFFRSAEREAVCGLSSKDGFVVATGGGCVLDPLNVAALRANGKIVYLKVGVEELYSRLAGDNSRPLLAGDARARLEELYCARSAVYESAADIIIECGGLSPEAVRDKILESMK